MRRLFAVIILLCIAYFVGGWIAVLLGVVTRDDYFAYSGVVGGLASVAGLLALTRPAITQSDFQAIEIETIRSMTDTAEQLNQLQTQRTRTAQEIDNLEVKKKEMELLVRKASLALFLKEQYAHHERQIIEEVGKNPRLRQSLEGASESAAKIAALDEDISSDPNVHQLRQIITAASRRAPTLDEALNDLTPLTRTLFVLVRALSRALTEAFRLIK